MIRKTVKMSEGLFAMIEDIRVRELKTKGKIPSFNQTLVNLIELGVKKYVEREAKKSSEPGAGDAQGVSGM